MEQWIQIQWAASSIEEARRVCRYLVQEQIAACCQITPWVESVYLWDGNLETAQETKVLIKTHRDNFDTIVSVIEKNCENEVPEIIFFSIEGSNSSYSEWLSETTRVAEAKS